MRVKYVDTGSDSDDHGAGIRRMCFTVYCKRSGVYKEVRGRMAMDYYHRSDSMLFVPACFFIMIIVCGFAVWSMVPASGSLPQVIKHVIVMPRTSDMMA